VARVSACLMALTMSYSDPPQEVQFSSEIASYSARARVMLDRLGLPIDSAPPKPLDFPSDLSAVADEDLGHHLSYWAAMCAYAHHKVAILEGALIIARSKFNNEYQSRMMARTGSFADRKVAVESSKAIKDYSDEIAIIEADLKVLKSVVIGYDLKNSAVSREITRRTHERSIRNG